MLNDIDAPEAAANVSVLVPDWSGGGTSTAVVWLPMVTITRVIVLWRSSTGWVIFRDDVLTSGFERNLQCRADGVGERRRPCRGRIAVDRVGAG